ncbi:Harbinger transposase-derived nuclease [Sergentomyia squamirostris]
MFGLVYLVLLYYMNKHYMRTERRYLRDTHNPFHIPEWMFMYYYRLPPTLAMNFIAEIEEFIMDSPDLRRIPLHIQVLCVLSFLTSGSYQLRVGMEAFNQISQTMISAFVKKICKIIVTNLSPRYLRFPRTQREAALIQYDFFMKTSLPGIIGIVDGTHISIGRLPRSVEPEYVNRKGKHSVNVQIICDSKYIESLIATRDIPEAATIHIFSKAAWRKFKCENCVTDTL